MKRIRKKCAVRRHTKQTLLRGWMPEVDAAQGSSGVLSGALRCCDRNNRVPGLRGPNSPPQALGRRRADGYHRDMAMDESDFVREAHEHSLHKALLDEALKAGDAVARAVTSEFSRREGAPTVSAEWGTDGPDDPAILFVVRLPIADDFDPEEWPDDLVADVKSAVRSQAVVGLPEEIPFYVIVSQRAPTQAA